jgi:CheY-like chemotaxis protein
MQKLILSVEDNPDDVLILNRAFQKANTSAHLEFLADGDQAIEYLADISQKPCPILLLLDLKLPKKSGLEVLAWVRSQTPFKRLPVVMLTSSNQPEEIDTAYDLGANSYLVKPGSIDDFVQLAKAIEIYWVQTNTGPGLNSLSR